MAINKIQKRVLMQEKSKGTLKRAALKAAMSPKTARKYVALAGKELEAAKPRDYRTRANPFQAHWAEIEQMLQNSPGLFAKTVLIDLQKRYQGVYKDGQLRTLSRLMGRWRLENQEGGKKAKFVQKHEPGKQSQSDWTWMNSLNITIAGQVYPHLMFHYVLSYSNFESIMICESESFETLTRGYEKAVLETAGICQEHRTDNLTAATQASGNSRVFTSRWRDFTAHYGVIPTRNNPGESHENGKVEKSHDVFKKAVDQELMLRGSRNFATHAEYEKFLNTIKDRRNFMRRERFVEEQKHLKPLPEKIFNEATLLKVRVNPESLVRILGSTYSVPSRYISSWLKAYVYRETIDLYLGAQLVLKLPRLAAGAIIDYRHIIDSFIRKPGAFEHYQYKSYMFPNLIFRRAYDALKAADSATASKEYCGLLYAAKMQGEQNVTEAIEELLITGAIPSKEDVTTVLEARNPIKSIAPTDSVHFAEPSLDLYDQLLVTESLQ